VGKRKAIGKKLRFQILQRDSHSCRYCGASAPDVELHVDHIKPVAEGGTNAPENLLTACSACNMGKGAEPVYVSTDEHEQKLSELRNELLLYVIQDVKDRFGVDFLDKLYCTRKFTKIVTDEIACAMHNGVSLAIVGMAACQSKSLDEWAANCTRLVGGIIDGDLGPDGLPVMEAARD